MALTPSDFAQRCQVGDTVDRQRYNTANGGFTLTGTPGSGKKVFVVVSGTNTVGAEPANPVVTVAGVVATV